MNEASLARALETARFGRWLRFDGVIDSTNDAAARWLSQEALPDGAVFVAGRQTKGRGTGGNPWFSDDSGGLYLSVVLHEPLPLHPLSFLPGVAVVDVLGSFGIAGHLKWPNDVLVERRKISGCLVESQREAGGKQAWIVGIGLNVNQGQFPEPIAHSAVSMRLCKGSAYPIEEVAAGLLLSLERLWDARPSLVEAWIQRTRMLGRPLRARRNGQRIEATALGLSPQGHLLVELADGRREEWVSRVDLDIEP